MAAIQKTVLFLLFATCLLVSTAAAEWSGKKSVWRGCDRYDFSVAGRACYVVVPAEPAAGNPWIWRARFPNYHPEPDLELLKRGFHVAHINTGGQLGSPTALNNWDEFYKFMTTEHKLAKRPALVAVSRGGLFAYRWAARHPDKVACIYGDTPVCDFKSWPLGRGKGVGHQGTWAQLLKAYGMTEEEALAWRENPVDVLKPLAEAKIPLMTIVTENDKIVPPSENTDLLEKRYLEMGGDIVVTRVEAGTAKSNGHHFDMTPAQVEKAVKFIADHAAAP